MNKVVIVGCGNVGMSYAYALLNQKNSVFISENISKSCNVHIGDLIEIQGIWHKVCGIYEQAITNVINATAVILWNGNYTNGTSVSGIKDGIVDYFDIYTRVYIKFKNYVTRKTGRLEKTRYLLHNLCNKW